jgi:hypothetical protein
MLKDSTNRKRTNWENSYKIYITYNWLLGFVEGWLLTKYASLWWEFFRVKKGWILTFSLTQKGNLPLMEAIQSYLFNLVNKNSSITALTKVKYESRNFIYITKWTRKDSSEFIYGLIIKDKVNIENVISPCFYFLTFNKKNIFFYWKSLLRWKT